MTKIILNDKLPDRARRRFELPNSNNRTQGPRAFEFAWNRLAGGFSLMWKRSLNPRGACIEKSTQALRRMGASINPNVSGLLDGVFNSLFFETFNEFLVFLGACWNLKSFDFLIFLLAKLVRDVQTYTEPYECKNGE